MLDGGWPNTDNSLHDGTARVGHIGLCRLVADRRVGFVVSQTDRRFDATIVPETGPFDIVAPYHAGNGSHI